MGVLLLGAAADVAQADSPQREFHVGAVRRILDYGLELRDVNGSALGMLNCRALTPLFPGAPAPSTLLLYVDGHQLDFPISQERCRQLRELALTEAAAHRPDRGIRIAVDLSPRRFRDFVAEPFSMDGFHGLDLLAAIVGISGGQPVYEQRGVTDSDHNPAHPTVHVGHTPHGPDTQAPAGH
ncbi:MAG TPA: hypothetical protein VL588_04135 [Bdellovibrionota bacterium]|nr:hypothetical protein [Bdellovibrionota bacterium]